MASKIPQPLENIPFVVGFWSSGHLQIFTFNYFLILQGMITDGPCGRFQMISVHPKLSLSLTLDHWMFPTQVFQGPVVTSQPSDPPATVLCLIRLSGHRCFLNGHVAQVYKEKRNGKARWCSDLSRCREPIRIIWNKYAIFLSWEFFLDG